MMIWQWPISSIRRISFRNAIWRAGDSADSGSSKMKMPWRWQRSSKKRRKPSPCECERKSGGGPPPIGYFWATSSKYRATEKKLSARKNQPLVIFGSQLARNALDNRPPISSSAHGVIDRHVALAAAGFVVAGEHGDAFKKCGFARAVLADDDGDRLVKTQFEIVAQQGKAERIGLAVRDAGWVEPDALQIRRRQIDRSVSS